MSNDDSVERSGRALQRWVAAGGDEHPDLFAYADGTLDADARAAVEEHLSLCEICREDAGDLRSLDVQRTVRRPRWWLAAAAALAIVAAAGLLFTRDDAPAVTPPVVRVTPPPVETRPAYERPEWTAMVEKARRTKRVEWSPLLATIRPPEDTLRGPNGSSSTVKLAPSGVILETAQPTFRWNRVDGAQYVVSIYSGRDEIARSEPLAASSWQPGVTLPRGRTYTWQLEVHRGDSVETHPAPPAPPARFHVLSAEVHNELAAARRAHPADPLLLGLLYAKHGLAGEAEQELAKVKGWK